MRSTAALQRPVFVVHVAGSSVTVAFVSTSAARQLGTSTTDPLQHSLWELFLPHGAALQESGAAAAATGHGCADCSCRLGQPDCFAPHLQQEAMWHPCSKPCLLR